MACRESVLMTTFASSSAKDLVRAMPSSWLKPPLVQLDSNDAAGHGVEDDTVAHRRCGDAVLGEQVADRLAGHGNLEVGVQTLGADIAGAGPGRTGGVQHLVSALKVNTTRLLVVIAGFPEATKTPSAPPIRSDSTGIHQNRRAHEDSQ